MQLKYLWFLAVAPPLIAFAPSAGAADYAVLKAVPAQTPPKTASPQLSELLGRHPGKPVLLNFWATWCEPCREEMPALGRLATRWQARGLVVQTIAVADKARAVEDFLWEVLPAGQSLEVLHDRDQVIGRAWGARVLPTTVVLDRHHRIVLRGMGAIDWDKPATDQVLQKLFN